MLTRRALLTAVSLAPLHAALIDEPQPYGALPSAGQLLWHEKEFYAFLHFSINTFTDKEWGYGDEDPNLFQPAAFDAGAIAEKLKACGMKSVMLTCKHHDGFCLWPTKTTPHSVASSKWRGGHGDVVRELSDAARKGGLKFGVYLSPWDRNAATYGTPAYVDMYRAQLRELLTEYGPIDEIWHDGANGGDGFYGGAREKRNIDRTTYYDWPRTWEIIRSLQPNAVIFSDVGPDIRWVGNELGIANETCWATYDPVGEKGGPASPGNVNAKESPTGTRNGSKWLPAECDVSIRPGWFWHENQNGRVKTPRQLLDLYYKSAGRGAAFLLNVPPDQRGLLHEHDVASLQALGEILRQTFDKNLAAGGKVTAPGVRGRNKTWRAENLIDGDRRSYWASDDSITTPDVLLEWKRPIAFNVIRIRENIRLGQRVEQFQVDVRKNDAWTTAASGTSIGSCRILRLPADVTTDKVRLRILKSPAAPALSELGLYLEPAG
jgi:alpha-L-fucosidase